MRTRLVIGAALLVAFVGSPVSADTIFSDNFNTENSGVGVINYTGFDNFFVLWGSVDLNGPGVGPDWWWNFPPVTDGHGLYVDLLGSTGEPGSLLWSNPIPLTPGRYELTFELAGSQRSWSQLDWTLLDVFFGGVLIDERSFLLGYTEPFARHTIPFTAEFAGYLEFAFFSSDPDPDNSGLLLDNIAVNAVPEPASLLLLGTGLVGLARWRRRRT